VSDRRAFSRNNCKIILSDELNFMRVFPQ